MTSNQKKKQRRTVPKRKQRRGLVRITILLFSLALLLLCVIFFTKKAYQYFHVQSTTTWNPSEDTLPAAEEEHVFTVCIDPGHGGKDIGANQGERLEKDDTLHMGLALKEYLNRRMFGW